MADNNDLKVIVGLNIPQSVVEIEDDLKIIEKTLANNDKGKLKITAGLNVGKTIGIINKQLDELKIDGSRLKITPTIDLSVGNQMAQQMSDQVNSAFSRIDFKHIAREIRELLNIKKNSGIKEITKDIQTMYESFNVDPDKYKESFNNILNWYQARSDDFILTEEEKVKQLNDLLSQLYNAPDRLITLPKIATYTKDNPLIVTTQTLEEMKTILGNMEEVKRLFGEVQVDDVNGKLIGSFGQDWEPKEAADALRVYIEYLQKIQELRGRNRLTLDEYRSKDDNEIWINQIEEAILKQYKFIEVSNRVAQSNEQIAQSQRDIAQAQREVQSAGGDQLSFNDQKTAENLEKTKELNNELIQGEKELVNLEKERTEIQNRLNQNKDAFKTAFEFDDNYDKLESAIKKDEDSLKRIEQEITNKTSANKVIKDQIKELSNQLREESQKINQSTQNMGSAGGNGIGTSSEYLSSNISKITAVTNSAKEAEQSFKNLLASMGDTKGAVVSKEFADAAGKVNSFTVAVKSGTGAFETFKYSIDGENGGFKLDNITAANAGIQRLAETIKKSYSSIDSYITSAQSSAQKIRAQWSDINGGKSVQDAEHISVLQSKYAELMKTIESLRGADENTIKTLKANIKAQEAELNSLVSSYHNAEKVATDLRTKGFDTVKDITGSKINTLEQSIVNTLGSTQKLSNELSSIHSKFEELGKTGLTQETKATLLTQILDDIDKAKAKLGTLSEVEKSVKSVERTMTNLDKMSGASIFSKYWNNDDVKQIQYRITQLKEDYKGALDVLKNNDIGTPKFKAAQDVIARLDEKFKELGVDIRSVRSELSNENDISHFQKQVANLTNTITTLQNNIHLTDSQKAGLSGLLNEVGLARDKATLDEIAVKLAKLRGEINQTTAESKNFDQISKSVEKVITDLNAMGRTQIFNTHGNNADVIEFQGKIKGLSDTAKQVKADLNALGDSKAIPPELKARIEELKKKFDELNGSNKTLQANLRQNDGWAKTERQIQTLTARIKEYMAVNTKAAKKYSGQFDGLLSGLSQAEINKDSEAVRRLSADFQILRSNIKAAGDQGKTFGQTIVDNIKKFSSWMSLTSVVMRAWHSLKQMVTTVKEIDQAMTSLKKVTNETAESYAKFLDDASVRAQKMHSSISDIVRQTEIWVKLGNDLNTASKLAEVSMMYAKVGDVDNESAVKDLVAAMKAFNIESENAIDIVSMLDKLNNEFAVSAKDLGEGLTVTASAMAAGGNSLEKTLSLMTGAGEITQDLQGVSNALRTISMRIRGLNQPLKQLYRLKLRDEQDRGKICNVLFSYAG